MVVDPVSEKFKADLTLFTQTTITAHTSGSKVIRGGGEYEIGNIAVMGIQAESDAKTSTVRTMYAVTIEDVSLFFIGNVSSPPPIELLDKIGNIDILFIPVGKEHLEPKSAAKLAKQLEPSIIVPYPLKQIAGFLEEMGQKCDTLDKLTLKKKDIVDMGEKTKIVCIKD